MTASPPPAITDARSLPVAGQCAVVWAIRVVLAATVLAGSFFYLSAEARSGALGFPLDDAWIHAQFARNLAEGHGLAFNIAEPSTGATAPLWTWLWAVPIAAGASVVVSGKVLGVLCAIATALLVFELTRRLAGSTAAGAVGAFAVALSPRLVWGALSGMEVPLYTALVTATLVAFEHTGRRPGCGWGALAGLATLARPETGVLFPLLAMVVLAGRLTSGQDSSPRLGLIGRFRSAATVLAWPCLAFVLVVGVDAVLNLWLSGRPLPATFYAKTEGAGLINALGRLDLAESWRSATARPFDALNQVIRYTVEQSALLFLFALPGLLTVLGLLRSGERSTTDSRTGAGVAALLLAGPLAMGALAPVSPLLMQEGRYVAHLLVAFFVVSAVGVATLARAARYPVVVWTIAVVALMRLASQNVSFAERHARQVDNINRMHVEMGRWLAAHSAEGAVIATNDIGAIAFFSRRRILDLEGLTTPAILPFKAGRCQLEYLRRQQPDLVVIFDEWYPHVASRTDLLSEVHRITVPRVTAAHDTLKVYRASWANAVADPACPRADRRDTAQRPSAAATSATASSQRRAG